MHIKFIMITVEQYYLILVSGYLIVVSGHPLRTVPTNTEVFLFGL